MLKRTLNEEEYQALTPDLQEDYHEQETDDGTAYHLQIEGMVGEDDVAGLRSALDKERETAKDAEADAKAKTKELDEARDKHETAITKIQEQKDAEITSLSEQLNAKENQSKSQRNKLLGQMGEALKGKAAVDAIAKHHGNSMLLLPALQKELEAVIDEDGSVRIQAKNAKDDKGKPLTADALVASMRKDTDYGGAFRGTGSQGGGMISDHSQYTIGGAHRFKGTGNKRRSQMTDRQKVDYINEHGDKAFQALPS